MSSTGPEIQMSLTTYTLVPINFSRVGPVLLHAFVADGVTSFIVPHKSSGYVVGVERTVVHADIDWKNSALTKCSTLATVDSGTTNRFNDAKCDASGRLWAGKRKRHDYMFPPKVLFLRCVTKLSFLISQARWEQRKVPVRLTFIKDTYTPWRQVELYVITSIGFPSPTVLPGHIIIQ